MKRLLRPSGARNDGLLYLASASPRRKEILKKMRIPFKIVKSSYREESHSRLPPRALTLRHAAGKARHASLPESARFVLGADTVVYARGQILGKPKTRKEAFEMLSLISGKTHEVFTGVAFWDRKFGKVIKKISKTRVYVKNLSRKEMGKYIDQVNSFDKAGAYAIQMKPEIVTKIQGSLSNVIGLPKEIIFKIWRDRS